MRFIHERQSQLFSSKMTMAVNLTWHIVTLSHKLHSLVPSNRDTEYSLRGGNNILSIPWCRTNRYANSFIIASSLNSFNLVNRCNSVPDC